MKRVGGEGSVASPDTRQLIAYVPAVDDSPEEPASPGALTVNDVLDGQLLRSVYQPLVHLESSQVVGFEALTRGPAGHRLESPIALLEEAEAEGRLAELDQLCRATAVRGALATGLDSSISLFVNVEPSVVGQPAPSWMPDLMRKAQDNLRLVIEFTERAITQDPASLLTAVEKARAAGFGIALDDVGAEPGSLALLPLVHPDVIKLDMGLLSRHRDSDVARICNAVRAHAERTGALVLAEGIETAKDVLVARTLGAEYGQGWHFGRPGALPAGLPAIEMPLPFLPVCENFVGQTPFEVVSAEKSVAVSTKRLLRSISRQFEDHAFASVDPCVVLACFQDAAHFTPRMSQRYTLLAQRSVFTAVLGTDVEVEPAPGVRGASLSSDDRLSDEWNVLVVGTHFAGALVARDLGDTGPDGDRRFEYAVTHDRELVLKAARSLIRWVAPTNAI